MTINYRVFGYEDYAQARALWERASGVGLSDADSPEGIRTYLERNPGTSFVATDARIVVGTVLCGHDGRRGLIHHLATADSYRRRGIATVLLQSGLRALRARGIDKCHLFVFRANAEGTAFWRAVAAEERTELALFSLPTKGD
ncbi:GNAT family N-acetyltransferase [Propionivibrio soli]|uniref:GNAT family N-acetyltransferase n=1 Tax=Propionivibrio soli TaxID=2976531 RepID=UPI0021E8C5D1|nr:GNAT family N-acetyltransferase [Propionivibrio soli]